MLRYAGIFFLSTCVGCTTYFDPARLDGSTSPNRDGMVVGACPDIGALSTGTDAVAIPDPGALPARGEWFRDPVHGTCIARLTDWSTDLEPPMDLDVNQPEARLIRGDGLEALIPFDYGEVHRYDVASVAHVSRIPALYQFHQPHYDLNDPTLIYYKEGFELRSVSPASADALVFDFEARATADFPGSIDVWLAHVPTSADMSRWAFRVRDGTFDLGAIVWDRSGTIVGSSPTSDGARIGISPSGRHIVIQSLVSQDPFRIHQPDLSDAGVPLEPTGYLLDWTLASLPNGHDALVWVERPLLVAYDIDESPPLQIASIAFEDRLSEYNSFEASVSGAAYDRPGWVVVTVGECMTPEGGACAPDTQWTQDRIAIVELTGEHRVFDVAFHHSTRGGGRSPNATPSRDLRRIFFASNWGDDAASMHMFLIELPADALPY